MLGPIIGFKLLRHNVPSPCIEQLALAQVCPFDHPRFSAGMKPSLGYFKSLNHVVTESWGIVDHPAFFVGKHHTRNAFTAVEQRLNDHAVRLLVQS